MKDPFNHDMLRTRPLYLTLTTLALLGGIACSGDNTTVIANEPVSQRPPDTAGDPQDNLEPQNTDTSKGGPLYIVNTTIDSPEGRLAYFIATPSIEGDVELDVSKGLEISGNARAYGLPGIKNAFLTSGGESPTFTRYDVQDDASFVIGDSMSFANLGVDNPNGQMAFASATKAYYFDNSQLQIISFNPESLEINQAIPVENWGCDDDVAAGFGKVLRRDNGFFVPRSCDWDSDGVTPSGAALLFLDTETDEVTVSSDSRCMGLDVGFVANNGDAYWFSAQTASVFWTMQQRDTPHDCVLRLRAGETTFDETWELDLTSRTGGVSAIASFPAGDSTIWMKVFDESEMTETIPMQEVDWGLKVWRWALLDVATDTPIELIEDEEPVVSFGAAIVLGNRSFTASVNSDGTTTLLELSQLGIDERMHVQGELRKIIELK